MEVYGSRGICARVNYAKTGLIRGCAVRRQGRLKVGDRSLRSLAAVLVIGEGNPIQQ